MVRVYKDGNVMNADLEQLDIVKKSGWSTEKPTAQKETKDKPSPAKEKVVAKADKKDKKDKKEKIVRGRRKSK